MSDGERLRQDELAAVLRRAAELDRDATAGAADLGLSVAAVESAAAEVGLAPEAVRQAVAELRAGMLDETAPAPSGPGLVVAARRVPWSVAEGVQAAEGFLAGLTFERVRDRGTARTYRRRNDTWAKVSRAVDFGGRSKRLEAVAEVDVRAVEVEGGTLLRLTARLNPGIVHAPTIAGSAVGVVGAGLFATGLALGIDPDLLGVAIGTAAGAGVGGGTFVAVRGATRREHRRVSEVLDGFLDELEQGRRPVDESTMARLRRQLPDLRRGGWRA